jgi:hypothetical protein
MTSVRPLSIVLAGALLAGCAASNSGISEKGPGTYFLRVKTPTNMGGGTESAR